jgi:hypothetical protein
LQKLTTGPSIRTLVSRQSSGVSPVTGPVVADAVTAGKSDSAIDQHNASMAAIVVPKKSRGRGFRPLPLDESIPPGSRRFSSRR